MPNILLTTYCNRKCPYCFAMDSMAESGRRDLTLRELVDIADTLVASRQTVVGVLGGEPTLHPDITEAVSYLLQRGLGVTVFTNGICRKAVLDGLLALPNRKALNFVVNVNSPDIESKSNQRAQDRFIKRFRDNVDLGVNVYRSDMDLTFLVDVARRNGLKKRRIRVGLAQPILGAANQFLSLGFYSAVAARLVELARSAFDLGIRLSLDCGFPQCAFADDQLGLLVRYGASIKFVCQAAIDISPDLNAWACFPLQSHTQIKVDRATRIDDLMERFRAMKTGIRGGARKGVFDECATCLYLAQGTCDGGCLAHSVTERPSQPPPS